MPPKSDLVHLSRLQVKFSQSQQIIAQTDYDLSGGTNPRRTRAVVQRIWQNERVLGQGGCGTVYLQRCIRCTQSRSQGQLRAVKEVRKLQHTNYDRELEAMALFSHPQYRTCFVESFGWYESESSVFVTMEYISNGDLANHVKEALPDFQAKSIVSQVMEGLNMMHERGFTHRDVKPANILVSNPGPQWWVKLADFGVSKRAESGITDLRTQVYTPAFAAPEVLQLQIMGGEDSDDDEPVYTNAVDIWSAGMVALLVLIGETMFHNRRTRKGIMNKGKLHDAILVDRPISSEAQAFMQALLQRDPGNRPSAVQCLELDWLRGANAMTPQQGDDDSLLDMDTLDDKISRLREMDQKMRYSARWTTIVTTSGEGARAAKTDSVPITEKHAEKAFDRAQFDRQEKEIIPETPDDEAKGTLSSQVEISASASCDSNESRCDDIDERETVHTVGRAVTENVPTVVPDESASTSLMTENRKPDDDLGAGRNSSESPEEPTVDQDTPSEDDNPAMKEHADDDRAPDEEGVNVEPQVCKPDASRSGILQTPFEEFEGDSTHQNNSSSLQDFHDLIDRAFEGGSADSTSETTTVNPSQVSKPGRLKLDSRLTNLPKRNSSIISDPQTAPPASVRDVEIPMTEEPRDFAPETDQLMFCRDYYSQDKIHPGDLVSCLFAYEPHAHDEFELNRGDMIKIGGMWSDGWAVGMRIKLRAHDWVPDGRIDRSRPQYEVPRGQVKAFPLVCVCLPQHWGRILGR